MTSYMQLVSVLCLPVSSIPTSLSFLKVFVLVIEYGSTLYVGLQLKQNGRPYKAMVRAVSKSRKEAFSKLQKVSSLHYHAFL